MSICRMLIPLKQEAASLRMVCRIVSLNRIKTHISPCGCPLLHQHLVTGLVGGEVKNNQQHCGRSVPPRRAMLAAILCGSHVQLVGM